MDNETGALDNQKRWWGWDILVQKFRRWQSVLRRPAPSTCPRIRTDSPTELRSPVKRAVAGAAGPEEKATESKQVGLGAAARS